MKNSVSIEVPFDALKDPVLRYLTHELVGALAVRAGLPVGPNRTEGGVNYHLQPGTYRFRAADAPRTDEAKYSALCERCGVPEDQHKADGCPGLEDSTPHANDPVEAEARWRAFVQGLPQRSQDFAHRIEEGGTVTVADLMDALGLASPKNIGGLAGGVMRWALERGIHLPFEKYRLNGQNGFRWVGFGEGAA